MGTYLAIGGFTFLVLMVATAPLKTARKRSGIAVGNKNRTSGSRIYRTTKALLMYIWLYPVVFPAALSFAVYMNFATDDEVLEILNDKEKENYLAHMAIEEELSN